MPPFVLPRPSTTRVVFLFRRLLSWTRSSMHRVAERLLVFYHLHFKSPWQMTSALHWGAHSVWECLQKQKCHTPDRGYRAGKFSSQGGVLLRGPDFRCGRWGRITTGPWKSHRAGRNRTFPNRGSKTYYSSEADVQFSASRGGGRTTPTREIERSFRSHHLRPLS